jgi:hypothetical protein
VEFGIKEYLPPRGELARLPIPNVSFAREKKASFIDEHMKRVTMNPGPDKYGKSPTWCEPIGIKKN